MLLEGTLIAPVGSSLGMDSNGNLVYGESPDHTHIEVSRNTNSGVRNFIEDMVKSFGVEVLDVCFPARCALEPLIAISRGHLLLPDEVFENLVVPDEFFGNGLLHVPSILGLQKC